MEHIKVDLEPTPIFKSGNPGEVIEYLYELVLLAPKGTNVVIVRNTQAYLYFETVELEDEMELARTQFTTIIAPVESDIVIDDQGGDNNVLRANNVLYAKPEAVLYNCRLRVK